MEDYKDTKPHTVCAIDTGRIDRNTCNNHGNPVNSYVQSFKEVQCRCDEQYTGKYCDYCKNSKLAYPDCKEGTSAAIYDPKLIHDFLNRKHYDMNGYSTKADRYFPAGSLEPRVFNEECGWVDLPDDLDRIEYGQEFRSSEFHIADVYTVNHKQDNIIKFKPTMDGIIKVMIQQPETEDADSAEYDIEIGIFDPIKK
jgi:hypothetical protein